jgi:hypothetical protein
MSKNMLDLIKTIHQELINRLPEMNGNIKRDIDFVIYIRWLMKWKMIKQRYVKTAL